MQKHNTKSAAISLLLILLVLIIAVGLIVELLRLYVPGIWAAFSSGDQNALQTCFDGQNKVYSAGLLWLLSFVQVLSIVIPSMPIQLVSGVVLGPGLGSAVCLTASVASHMAVFGIASRAKQLLHAMAEAYPKLGKTLNTLAVNRNRTYYTVMVLLAPGLPNGIIPYAAANSGIKAYLYFSALLIALPLPTWITCMAGGLILSGDWVFSIVMLAVLYGIVGFLFLKRDSLPEKIRGVFHRAGNQKSNSY